MASLNFLLEKFVLDNSQTQTFWIAFSGGRDSAVLLHAMMMLRSQYSFKLKAIHVNHNLQKLSDSWQQHCEELCAQWNVECVSENIQINSSTNIEEHARNARYEIFAKLLDENDLLLTAHHQDDQAETVLLQLLRGAGPKGLSAMPAEKFLGKGKLCRPLLTISRDEIYRYAMQHDITWIDDPSNVNTHYARNFLRADILSLLTKRFPGLNATLSRVADNCQETQKIIAEIAKEDLQKVVTEANTLSLSKLTLLSPERQRQVLRLWLQELNFQLPNHKKLQQLQNDFLTAARDRFPFVKWKDVELRRYNDELYAMKSLPEIDNTLSVTWDLQTVLNFQNVTLHAVQGIGEGLRMGLENISVRFRQGGELCKLPNKTITQELKKIFQERNVPIWERDRTPLIFVDDKLAYVVNHFVVAEFAAKPGEGSWRVMTDERNNP